MILRSAIVIQLGLEYVCDIDFQPRNSDLVAVIGKEHLGWWKIQQNNIELLRIAEYQVNVFFIHFIKNFLNEVC